MSDRFLGSSNQPKPPSRRHPKPALTSQYTQGSPHGSQSTRPHHESLIANPNHPSSSPPHVHRTPPSHQRHYTPQGHQVHLNHPAPSPRHPSPTPVSNSHPSSPYPQYPRPPSPAYLQTQGYESRHSQSFEFQEHQSTAILEKVNPDAPMLNRGKITVLHGENKGQVWYLNRPQTTIGRGLDNDITLFDIATSRKHAYFQRHEDGFTLIDARSANGLYLNSRRIQEEELFDGDEIELGETVLLYETVGQPRIREAEENTDPAIYSYPLEPRPSKMAKIAENIYHFTQAILRRFTRNDIDFYWTWEFQKNRGLKWIGITLMLIISLAFGRYLSRLNAFDQKRFETELVRLLHGQKYKDAQDILQKKETLITPQQYKIYLTQIQKETERTETLKHVVKLIDQKKYLKAYRTLKPLALETNHPLKSETDAHQAKIRTEWSQTALTQFQTLIWKGQLQKAHEFSLIFDEFKSPLTPHLFTLRYALFVHQNHDLLKSTILNPSPRDQKILLESAQLIQAKKWKRAIRVLKRHMPTSSSRSVLFKHRIQLINALKKGRRSLKHNQRRKRISALIKYYRNRLTLGEYIPDIYTKQINLFDHQIQKYSQQGEYEKVAPYLQEGLILNPTYLAFTKMSQRLQQQVQIWVNEIPSLVQQRDFGRAKHYYKIGRLYLKEDDLEDVADLVDSIP